MVTGNVIAKRLGYALAFGLAFMLWPNAATANETAASGETLLKLESYGDYLERHAKQGAGRADLTIEAHTFVRAETNAEILESFEGMEGKSVRTGDTGIIEWEVDVPASGMYNIEVLYYPVEGKGNDIERMLYVDGAVPYDEAKAIRLSRIWKDTGDIDQDRNGNDIRPRQAEAPRWRTTLLHESLGYYNDPLQVYLEEGRHTIGLESVREPAVIRSIRLYAAEKLKPYAEVAAFYEAKGYREADAAPVKIQAQLPYEKSDNTLYPIADRSSPLTEPQDPAKLRLNSIGGDKWKLPGQWVTYRFTVEEDGLYKIVARFKQQLLAGMYVNRKVLIDGKVPFQEAEAVRFNYGNRWQVQALGDGEREYEFYLEAGEHELTFQVTLGDLADVLRRVDASLFELNAAYRQILMITGSDPDLYRDYDFKKLIPDAIATMAENAEELKRISAEMEEFTGQKGEQTVLLDKIAFQLEQMVEDPEDRIAKTFGPLKENIGALGTWILTVGEQPLTLDYVSVVPTSAPLPQAEPSFLGSLLFEIRSFLLSFVVDYNTLAVQEEDEEGREVEVWLTSGRDQAQIIREMLNDAFTPETGIHVKLKLIPEQTLLPSVLAGTGPDVAMGNPVADPVQYALRNAVQPIQEMPNFEEVASRFHSSAMVPYTFEGQVYALPETQSFPMLFYRKDILLELGLEVPETWDEFYRIIPEIQKQNLQIGFPQDITGLQIFLYQNGGELYEPRRTRSTLDADATVEAFQKQTELFTTYRFPRDYDFANRFRTGEMPLGIADYTTYNQLIAFAPEIRGLWEFAPLPGTVRADGTIDRATPATGTAVMMLKGVEDKDAAWRFMEWWTRADTQSRFGREMEAVLGKSAKQATANLEALASMPWTEREAGILMEQWSYAVGTPEVPGGYYVTRSIGFAAAAAYNDGDPEALLDYVRETDEEIARKRKEFRLGGHDDE